jgi:hypothetical protein
LCGETERADIRGISVGLGSKNRVMQLLLTCCHGDCFRTFTCHDIMVVQNSTVITLNLTNFCFCYQMMFNYSCVFSFPFLLSLYFAFFLPCLHFFYPPAVFFLNLVHEFFFIYSFSFSLLFSSFNVSYSRHLFSVSLVSLTTFISIILLRRTCPYDFLPLWRHLI